MKHHDHEHGRGDPHHHEHGGREHQETTAAVNHPSTDTAPPGHSRESGNPSTSAHSTNGSTHHQELDSRLRGNDGAFGRGLLMTSSLNRVLGASVLIALLWLAVAWAVLFID